MKRFLIPLAFAISLASCTVIEDRSECPCWLEVRLEECREDTDELFLQGWNNTKSLFTDHIAVTPESERTSYKVERGTVFYSAYYGLSGDNIKSGKYVIPQGSQMTYFYGYKAQVTVDTDFAKDVAKPIKQYCNLTVIFDEDFSSRYQDMEAIISSTSGIINLNTFQAEEGVFSVKRYPGRDSQLTCCLPRQGFGDLTLELFENGMPICSWNLSAALDVAKYDWKAGALKDARVTLSLTSSDIDVVIGDWSEGGEFEPTM